MADYGLGLGGTPPISPPPGMGGGMVDNPAYPGGSSGGMGTGIPQENPPAQSETPSLGLGPTAPAAPNGGASGGAGGGSFTPGQGLNWQGASPADLYGQFQSLDPGLQQSYINYYMNNLDPTQQANWRQAFGQDQPALGMANPQMATAQKNIGGAMPDPSMAIHSQQPTPGLGGSTPPSTQEMSPSGTPGLGSINGAGLGALGNVSTPYTGAYPQSWIDMYNRQSAGIQTAMRDRFSGLSPDQITQDWNNNIQPNYTNGTTPEQILSGAPTGASPPSTTGSIQGAGLGMSAPGYQIGNNNNAPGGAGTLARAQADPGDYWRQHMNDSVRAGANQGEFSPGSGVQGKDPWTQPAFTRDGRLATSGYAMGAPQTTPAGQWGAGQNRQLIKWDQAGGPAPAMTTAGQQELSQPISAGGQSFNGLQDFLTYMMNSTPGEQALKQRLSGMDAQGDTLQEGERTLFDTLAPYLSKGSTQPQPGATPFTDWDPLSLLHLLMKSGILNKA